MTNSLASWDNLIPQNFNLNLIHNTYAIIGMIMVLYGIASVFFTEKLFINEAVLALSFGIILGPNCIGLVDPDVYFGESLPTVLLEFSRLIIGICCTKIGILLPQ
jgi:sodium/hydrogen antiporter